MKRTHSSGPGEVRAHDRLVAVAGNHAGLEFLQVRVGLETPIPSSDVAVHGVEIDVTRRSNQSVGLAVIITFDMIIEGLHDSIGRRSVVLESAANIASGDKDYQQNNHENRKNAAHYLASRSTTGSASGVGNSTVSAMRRRSGNNIRNAIAMMTVETGSVPHKRPSKGVGCAPGGG